MCKYKYSALKSAKKHTTISGGGTRRPLGEKEKVIGKK